MFKEKLNYLVTHESTERPSHFVKVHVGRKVRSEENENESDRHRNLHQVRHDDGRGQSDDRHQRLVQRLEGADHGHRALGAVLHSVHDAVAAVSVGDALKFGEGWSGRQPVLVHVDL